MKALIEDFIPDPGRSCTGCTACCRIEGTPDGPPCSHIKGHHCGIYAKRPYVCRLFQCLWRTGYLPKEMHPESCGVLVHLTGNKWIRKAGVEVIEQRHGALGFYEKKLEALTSKGCLVTLSYMDGRRTWISEDPDWIAEMRKRNPSVRHAIPADTTAVKMEGVEDGPRKSIGRVGLKSSQRDVEEEPRGSWGADRTSAARPEGSS